MFFVCFFRARLVRKLAVRWDNEIWLLYLHRRPPMRDAQLRGRANELRFAINGDICRLGLVCVHLCRIYIVYTDLWVDGRGLRWKSFHEVVFNRNDIRSYVFLSCFMTIKTFNSGFDWYENNMYTCIRDSSFWSIFYSTWNIHSFHYLLFQLSFFLCLCLPNCVGRIIRVKLTKTDYLLTTVVSSRYTRYTRLFNETMTPCCCLHKFDKFVIKTFGIVTLNIRNTLYSKQYLILCNSFKLDYFNLVISYQNLSFLLICILLLLFPSSFLPYKPSLFQN